jgi:hypothetical protein
VGVESKNASSLTKGGERPMKTHVICLFLRRPRALICVVRRGISVAKTVSATSATRQVLATVIARQKTRKLGVGKFPTTPLIIPTLVPVAHIEAL